MLSDPVFEDSQFCPVSREEKIGKQKHHDVLTKRLLALVEKIEETQRLS